MYLTLRLSPLLLFLFLFFLLLFLYLLLRLLFFLLRFLDLYFLLCFLYILLGFLYVLLGFVYSPCPPHAPALNNEVKAAMKRMTIFLLMVLLLVEHRSAYMMHIYAQVGSEEPKGDLKGT
ncbi:MAG TPA: hypothetical protein VK361_05675 [Rubrobacteraceae bacterium]|nr:hypothetical protein [Rubrobacteraceae bacterium]